MSLSSSGFLYFLYREKLENTENKREFREIFLI